MHATLSRFSLLAAALLASGCATTLSTMDTARPVPVGHVHADLAGGFYVPAGQVFDVIGEAGDIADGLQVGQAPTPEQEQKILDAALALVLMPPAMMQELMIRTGVHKNADVGLRFATTSIRLDGKYQFYDGGDEQHGTKHASVGLGISKYQFKGMAFDVLEKISKLVTVDDFSRWDFEVPVLYSFEYRDFFVFYTGAKYILTTFSFDENLFDFQSAALGEEKRIIEKISSTMHFAGGVLGLGLGYKYAFLYVELDGGYTWASPKVRGLIDGEMKQRDLGGVTLYPALGLVLKI